VLGSGLAAGVRARIDGVTIPYAKLHVPATTVAGHAGEALVGTWAERRVLAFAGRAHLYEGYGAHAVTHAVRLAAACGAQTIVLTNAAGALDPSYARGDIMLVADHLNCTGASPIDASKREPFVPMHGAYAADLREFARADGIREGIYAGVRGPHYETVAESEALRRLGADAIGMSTVLETIAARQLGLAVLGISLITNTTSDSGDVSHDAVLAASADGAERLAALIERVLRRLPQPVATSPD